MEIIKRHTSKLIEQAIERVQLSPEIEQTIEEVWAQFDQDGNGVIDASELNEILETLNIKPTEDELSAIVLEIDQDGDGTIDKTEFLQMIGKRLKEAQSPEQLKEAFTIFDCNQKGNFSREDLQKHTARIGLQFSRDELDNMMLIADLDGAGFINFDEFVRVMLAYQR